MLELEPCVSLILEAKNWTGILLIPLKQLLTYETGGTKLQKVWCIYKCTSKLSMYMRFYQGVMSKISSYGIICHV